MGKLVDVKIEKINSKKALVDVIVKATGEPIEDIKASIETNEIFVRRKAKNKGIKIDSPQYFDLFKKHIESTYENRIPALAQNPTQAFVNSNIMHHVFTDILGPDGVLKRYTSSDKSFLDSSHIIRSSVNAIAKLYMKLVLKLKKDDYTFEYGVEEPENVRKDILLKKYKKFILVGFIAGVIENIFSVKPEIFNKWFDSFGLNKYDSKKLNSLEFQEEFQKAVRDDVRKTFTTLSPTNITKLLSKENNELPSGSK